MKTDMDYTAEQCAEIDRRQGVKPTSACMVDSVVRFLKWADRDFLISDVFRVCGCEHGFKPARDCPHAGCKRAEMNRLFDEIMSESNSIVCAASNKT